MHLCEVATFREPFDVVLLLMKAYDTRWACQLIEPHLAPDGLVVGVQNGMTVDTIADVVGPARTMGCVIEISSMMFDPGVVERHSPPSRSWFAVGSLDPATAGREDEIADAAAARRRRRGRRRHPRREVDEARQQRDDAGARRRSSGCRWSRPSRMPGMRELHAARPDRRRWTPAVGARPPASCRSSGSRRTMSRDRDRVVETLLDTLLGGFVLPNTKTTILQDWMKGRHSEVDDLNGLVAREQAPARRSGAGQRRPWSSSPTGSSGTAGNRARTT